MMEEKIVKFCEICGIKTDHFENEIGQTYCTLCGSVFEDERLVVWLLDPEDDESEKNKIKIMI